MSSPRLGVLFFMLLLWQMVTPLAAHPMDEWFTEMHWTNGEGLKGRFRVPADQRARLVKQPITFRNGQEAMTATWTDLGLEENGRLLVELRAPSSQPAVEIAISLPPGLLDENQSLVGFLDFEGGEPTTVMVPAGQTRTVAVPTSGQSASADLSTFFQLGLKHILEGTDHLLFLFCLLIAGGTLRHLIIVVTAFTVGHSITLALSVLGLISFNSTLIESLIALSIVLAALFNLKAPKDDSEETGRKTAMNRGAMALGFGLIHGMGFATMLLENGLSGTGVLTPLFGFNAGVEAGQLGLVLIFYPVLYAIHRSRHRRSIVVTCSVMGACMGVFWLLERLGVINMGV